MSFSADDLVALWLTVKLATTVTIVLLVICTPLAWWLATTASRWRGPISAIVALPLVLPPTVLGFYFLLGMGPHGAIGQLTHALGLGYLPFHLLGFAHTVGEFGVVLMIGGNIPDETRVVSVALYDHVEAMNYGQAHGLAAVLLTFSFITLLVLYSRSPRALMLVRSRP